MIDYSPFWKTLEKSNENWYSLTKEHHISFNTLSRIKNNKDVTTKTINDFCRIFNCEVKDIIKYVPSNKDQKL
ncbi:MAG: helix-turn-helix domain-containing protein [Lachnospiraceae bacterium]|nr:helix-turn-helix domain-containing protein [Lachnospiraceae bacterium]